MTVLIIDNYDSFVFNLAQYIGESEDVLVVRNDAPFPEDFDRAVISPGPGRPEDAGKFDEFVKEYGSKVPILGVCLGHQAIAVAYGGKVLRAPKIMHGKTSKINHDGRYIYNNIKNPFTATRYHSLIVEEDSLPDCLIVTATSDTGDLMGIRHKEYKVEGVQFHPESILTSEGMHIIKNYLER